MAYLFYLFNIYLFIYLVFIYLIFNIYLLIYYLFIILSCDRVTASTGMNDTSSRSHAIFTINFTQVSELLVFPCCEH